MTAERFRNVENLVVRHEGTSSEKIIIGAHYDIAERGCGAVNNWRGIVAMAHIFRSILNFKGQKTVIFVAFGQEERGLVGSRAMANAIPREQVPQYCAMINIDGFGLAAPLALTQSSSDKLVRLADEISEVLKVPFTGIRLAGADSDSTSFKARNIPSVTLSGLSAEWPNILHTVRDQPNQVVPLTFISAIGWRSQCGAGSSKALAKHTAKKTNHKNHILQKPINSGNILPE